MIFDKDCWLTAEPAVNLILPYVFDQLFKTNYGKGTDNEQLMIKHNWLPVYDCGQKVFVWYNEERVI